MRLPVKPPKLVDLMGLMVKNSQRLMTILSEVKSPSVSGKYLHWDKLRFHRPPGDLSPEEWWLGIKYQRSGRPTPLLDKGGEPFMFNLADPLSEYLHEIDLLTGGVIRMPEQVTNTETRNSYVVRSLVEEAFTSSQLEGAASTREIAKELIRQERTPRDRGERMILNNYKTMLMITELRDAPLSKELVLEIHRMVTQDALDDPTGAGRFRRSDEVRVVGDDEGNIFHLPPDASQLERRMADLCDFANENSGDPFIHPAIRSMIIHFWLAYDHPFIDGNGRTARALFYWSMLKHGYWLFEFVSISHVIIKSSSQYGRAFLHSETDGNDLTYFLIYHASVVKKAITELNEYIKARSKELKNLETGLRGMVSLNYRQKELISHAIRHPGRRYTVESHRASHNVSRATSNNDLLQLEKKGLLRRIPGLKVSLFVAVSDLEQKLNEYD